MIQSIKYVYLCTKNFRGSPFKVLQQITVDLATTGLTSFEVSPIKRTVKSSEPIELDGYTHTNTEVIEVPDPEPVKPPKEESEAGKGDLDPAEDKEHGPEVDQKEPADKAKD